VEKSKLNLLAVSPPDGGNLDRNTIIEADVEFQIADFEPKSFRFMTLFPTAGYGSMSPLDAKNTPYVESAIGKVHLCVPLGEVYEHPTMKWPLSMQVSVLRESADGGGRGVVSTRAVKFNVLDIPEGALARQAAAPPQEYHDALMKAGSFFTNRVTVYKVCIARYPAIQPAMTKAYRAWESRHREAIELAASAQFDAYKAEFNGREDIAARIYDAGVDGQRKLYEKMPDGEFSKQCQRWLEEYADTEDPSDSAISDELAMIRKYYPVQPVQRSK
jgi:hypothetical protein